MTIRPGCPDHHDLVLDLARGRLGDDTANEAEAVRRSCPTCSSWWRDHLEGEVAVGVDAAVAAALGELSLPTRRPRRGWLAAAAAVVTAFGVGGLWLAERPQPAAPALEQRVAVIESFDFESPASRPELVVAEARPQEPEGVPVVEVPETSLPSPADEVRVAAVPPARPATANADSPIFAGGFETGDLGGWVPGT